MHGFGPPPVFARVSAWPRVDRCGFGSTATDSRPLRLAFASAPRLPLNLASDRDSPVHSSIGTPSRSYGAPTACRHTVSGSFHSPPGVLFHFSLTVLFAIGRPAVFSLGGWSPLLPTGFLVSRGTPGTRPLAFPFAYQGFAVCAPPFHAVRLGMMRFVRARYPGAPKGSGLGCVLFARRYSGYLG